MPSYANGYIPAELLVVFNRGHNQLDGDWVWALSRGTLEKHNNLVARAKARTGKNLSPGDGPSCYRSYPAQVITRRYYESIGRPNLAARAGTSSHGGLWEGRQTLAIDYSNWYAVYGGAGERAAFFADCRAVGLEPGMISTNRGYPDEPWHVIDLDPWRPVLAGTGSTPFPVGFNAIPTVRKTEDIQRLVGATPDGVWGPRTTQAVIAWQKQHNLTPDGVWGYVSDRVGFPPKPVEPKPEPAPELIEEYPEMFIAYVNKACYLIVPQGSAKPQAVLLGGEARVPESGIPVLYFTWNVAIDALRRAVDGIQ